MSPAVRRRLPAQIALVAGLLLLVVGAVAPPAGAHGDEGVMTVTTIEQVASDRVRVEVGIVYANDDDPAEEAAVTATLTSPDGQVVGPVPLPVISGAVYGAEIDVPGPATWQVSVASTTPAATADTTVDVVATAPETTAPPTTDAEPAPLIAPAPDTDQTASADDDADDSNGAVLVIVGLVGLAVIAAAAAFVVLRRRSAAA